jgi:NAD(P)H-hydrate epimerase
MLSEDGGECFSRVPDGLLRFTAIAVGPGLGRTAPAEETFASLLTRVKEQESPIPMVLDADALFILAAHPELMKLIPAGSVMTPHEVELRRLISWNTPEEKELELKTLCKETGCVVVAKSHLTEIYTPEGEKYVNTTGNAGLAKGGSGDVLTGLVGGLLARGYSALEAAALGVWIHGRAADALTAKYTAEAYSSRDLIDALYYGFKALE